MAGCQDNLDQAQTSLYDVSTDDAADSLATYGYCVGSNAAYSFLANNAIVKDVEAAILKGELEAAAIVAELMTAMNLFALSGVAVGAIATVTSVMPIIGVCVAVVIAAVEILTHIGPGPQLFVPNPQATGDDVLKITFQDGSFIILEKINLSDYGGFIQNAIQWIQANPKIAVTMTAEDFSAQHNIFIDKRGPNHLTSGSAPVVRIDGDGYGNDIQTGEKLIAMQDGNTQFLAQTALPPGAYELLRIIQLPAASAVVAAMPTYANYYTNNDGALGGGINSNAPLMKQFPALKDTDMAAIFKAQPQTGTASNAWHTAYTDAQLWAGTQCPPPSITTLSARYKLPPSDCCTILQAWIPPNGCGSVAPKCSVSYNVTDGITEMTGAALTASQNAPDAPAATAPTSTTAKVVTAAAAIGAGAIAWNVLIRKQSLAATGRSIEHGVTGGFAKLRSKLHFGRRSNPIDPAAATGGRTAAFRVNLALPSERIALTRKGNAIFYRYDKPIAKFRPSKFQKSKIRAGAGEMLIFTDQLE